MLELINLRQEISKLMNSQKNATKKLWFELKHFVLNNTK